MNNPKYAATRGLEALKSAALIYVPARVVDGCMAPNPKGMKNRYSVSFEIVAGSRKGEWLSAYFVVYNQDMKIAGPNIKLLHDLTLAAGFHASMELSHNLPAKRPVLLLINPWDANQIIGFAAVPI